MTSAVVGDTPVILASSTDMTKANLVLFFFFLMIRRPPRSPLLPYPPLFRSPRRPARRRALRRLRHLPPRAVPPARGGHAVLAALLPAGDRGLHRALARPGGAGRGLPLPARRSEEHTSELQSQSNLVCRLLLE